MQSFPGLDESSFIKTRRRIHSVAKVIGKFRETLVKLIAKNDNLWLSVVEQGFCTPPMNDFNELEIGCNIEKMIVEIADSTGKYEAININGKTAGVLCNELKDILNSRFGVSTELDSAGFDTSNVIEVDILNAKEFSAQFINYSKLLYGFYKTISSGVKTQICLWPHHFDNAFKWFSGRVIGDDEELMGIGVSNGDETYELPYVYMTLYPPLRKTNTLEIAEGATLHDHEWTGLILPYESVMEKKSAEEQSALINNFFEVSFKSIQRGFSKR
jgi:hypothetical protein